MELNLCGSGRRHYLRAVGFILESAAYEWVFLNVCFFPISLFLMQASMDPMNAIKLLLLFLARSRATTRCIVFRSSEDQKIGRLGRKIGRKIGHVDPFTSLL